MLCPRQIKKMQTLLFVFKKKKDTHVAPGMGIVFIQINMVLTVTLWCLYISHISLSVSESHQMTVRLSHKGSHRVDNSRSRGIFPIFMK